MKMYLKGCKIIGPILVLMLPLLVAGCPAPQLPVEWPIAKDVFTTAQQQILPVAISPSTPPVNPKDVALYDVFGYSAWRAGDGTDYSQDPNTPQPYDKRTDLAPDYTNAPNAARLLSFFSISDIHITDKESPAQMIYAGWSQPFGTGSVPLMNSAYSPIINSTTQVLDATIQTVNALHEKSPIDFGISLGDNINNNQYNELRWFIDVMDGKIITPSSGAHAGARTIDYQKPFKAAGLDKSIPWYQVLGNHDQYLTGLAYETEKTRAAHIGSTVLNVDYNVLSPTWTTDSVGYYMGVVDGTTPLGDIIGAGPQAYFPTPPTVVPDEDRHALSTPESNYHDWMKEFFHSTSKPLGHGFSLSNLANDFACYTFEPKSDIPIRVIVLDNTSKPSDTINNQLYIGSGQLDQARHDWLINELQKGQDDNVLMIVASHIPIKPQTDLNDSEPLYQFYDHAYEDSLLATLHNYPNLIMWIAGHRHLNTVTPMPYDPEVEGHGPENSFWEVETASLRDFPQQLRTYDIRRNSDNTVSIFVTNVDPAVVEGSPAAKSRGYAIAVNRIYGATPEILADETSHSYNAELVKQLTPEMQTVIANSGTPLQ